MLEKRQRWVRDAQSSYSSLLAEVPHDQHPQWPTLTDMETWPKRRWEKKVHQLRAKLRALALGRGFVLAAHL